MALRPYVHSFAVGGAILLRRPRRRVLNGDTKDKILFKSLIDKCQPVQKLNRITGDDRRFASPPCVINYWSRYLQWLKTTACICPITVQLNHKKTWLFASIESPLRISHLYKSIKISFLWTSSLRIYWLCNDYRLACLGKIYVTLRGQRYVAIA